MKYKTLNGKVVEGETPRDIAKALRAMMLVPDAGLEEWMAGSAKRAKDWSGAEVSAASPEEHIRDLVAAGMLEPV